MEEKESSIGYLSDDVRLVGHEHHESYLPVSGVSAVSKQEQRLQTTQEEAGQKIKLSDSTRGPRQRVTQRPAFSLSCKAVGEPILGHALYLPK